jgi:pyruvate kinase
MRKTRIVCTIGPASSSEAVIEKLILAGMNVARLNFSHGDHGSHRKHFERLRKLSASLGKPLGILADLCGPKIRLGQMNPDSSVEAGQTFRFLTQPIIGDSSHASITYSNLPNEIEVGQRILVDDGKIEFQVTEVQDGVVVTEARNSGILLSKKGVNLPGVALSVPSVTDKDKDDLRFALELGVDFIALSFIRKPEDLSETRALMRELGREVPLIAKIEKTEALDQLGAIINESDAIMIARGDLGVELPLEDVPLIQKRIIAKCKAAARPVITATQMLESMTEFYRPTRAEVNDVANAILDGTDAVMLSAETASGHYPEQAVTVMHKVAQKAETGLDYQAVHQLRPPRGNAPEAVAQAAVEISEEVSARAILACTRSGRTVRALSRFRPRAPILGIASDESVLRQFSLNWGVTPIGISDYSTTDDLVAHAMNAALAEGGLRPGDTVVIVAGTPLGHRTNTVMVRTLLNQPASS